MRNNSNRVNHKNFANKLTHPHPNIGFVPQAVLTRSGKINTAGASVTTADRPVNTVGSKSTVNHPRIISKAFKRGHSHDTRPYNKFLANKSSIFHKKVNTVRVNDSTARYKAVVNGNMRREANPQQKENKEKRAIDSGYSRHMTGNKCYLTDFEGYDGGFISFGDGKGRISGKGNGPYWLFDIDYLTISMNYKPVVLGKQTNGIAGIKDNIVTGQAEKKKEPEQEYILIPICTTDPLISQGPKDIVVDVGKKSSEVDERTYGREDAFLKGENRLKGCSSNALLLARVPAALIYDGEAVLVNDGPAVLTLQVQQKSDGIFISQEKYVDDILKKFDFTITSHLHAVKRIYRYLKGQPKLGLWYPRDSPFDLEAYFDSDYVRASHDRKSTTRGCQFLRKRLISWPCKKQTIVANSTIKAEYVAAASCYGHVLWIQNQMLDYGFNLMNTKIYFDNESIICIVKNPAYTYCCQMKVNAAKHKLTTVGDGLCYWGFACLPNDAIFEGLSRIGAKTTAWNEFSSTMESAIICLPNNQEFNFSKYILENMRKHKPRRKLREATKVPHTEPQAKERVPTPSHDPLPNEDRLKLNELMDICIKSSDRVLSLDQIKTNQATKIKKLKTRVKKLEGKKKRTHGLKRLYKVGLSARVESSEDEEDQGRIKDQDLFGVHDLDGDEVFVDVTTGEDVEQDATIVESVEGIATATTPQISKDELTLAQTLMEIKAAKPKAKGVTIQEPNFIPASPDYIPTSPGKTYSISSNSFGVVPIASPSLSLLHDDPYMKVLQAFYTKKSPIPPPIITPSSSMPNPEEFFLLEELLSPKKQGHDQSSSSTSTLPQIFKIGESSRKTSQERHEEQIEGI
nr:putative ribonuclease H-like domain-containing protein [Tanacetum cinerariifolium]